MVHQQDPCGLMVFDDRLHASLPARSKRSQIGHVLSLLAKTKSSGRTDIAKSLGQVAAMLRHRSLVMIFSDLLGDPEPIRQSLLRLRHRGHDVIVFHVLDEAEEKFPFEGMVEFTEPEEEQRLVIDADAVRNSYIESIRIFRDDYRKSCSHAGIDYVPFDTSMQFDRALMGYLTSRAHSILGESVIPDCDLFGREDSWVCFLRRRCCLPASPLLRCQRAAHDDATQACQA